MPRITERVRYFSMPGDPIAIVDCGDLSDVRWYTLIETLVPGFARKDESLAEKLRFYVGLDGRYAKRLEIGPDWIAEEIIRHLGGGVGDLSLEEYLAFMLTERAKTIPGGAA